MASAIDSLKQALDADRSLYSCSHVACAALRVFGTAGLALQEFRIAYRNADPHQPITYKALVTGLIFLRRYEEAALVLREVMKANPENADAFAALSIALFV